MWRPKKIFVNSTILFSLLTASCSPSSMFTSEGAYSSAAGGILGTGIGYAIGQQVGKTTENMLLAGTIGSGIGLMAGGLLHEHNIAVSQKQEVLIRQVRMVDDNQREIDSLREKLHDSTSWGGNEVKPWNERYWGDNYQHPYEGTLSR